MMEKKKQDLSILNRSQPRFPNKTKCDYDAPRASSIDFSSLSDEKKFMQQTLYYNQISFQADSSSTFLPKLKTAL